MSVDIRQLAHEDYLAGMKYQDIADKYGVTLSAVKTWAKRYWKVAKKVAKGCNHDKVAKSESSNHNTDKANNDATLLGCKEVLRSATSNKKFKNEYRGGQPQNTNAVKTGEYQTIWLDALNEDEQSLFHGIDTSPLAQIDEDIRLLTIRERRMLQLLNELKGQREEKITPKPISDIADNVTVINEQRTGKDKNTQIIVERHIADKILAIEEALTRVQSKKIKAIDAKHRMMKDAAGELDNEINITIRNAGEPNGH